MFLELSPYHRKFNLPISPGLDLQQRQNSGSDAGNNGNASGSKPNFFVFQNKMNSRPSLHNQHHTQQATVNGFGNAGRTARNSGSATNKYQLVGSTPVSSSAVNVQQRMHSGASANRKNAWNASTKATSQVANQTHGGGNGGHSVNLFGQH